MLAPPASPVGRQGPEVAHLKHAQIERWPTLLPDAASGWSKPKTVRGDRSPAPTILHGGYLEQCAALTRWRVPLIIKAD